MIHFVFDWTSDSAYWNDKLNVWYYKNQQLLFNESVEYIKRFMKKKIDYNALILHYSPQFRYFLQNQGIAPLNYWSAFDWIQGIDIKEANPIDYRQLPWPAATEFLYNPFAIMVLTHGELFAKIEFGNDSQLIWIDYYQNGQVSERHLWDDRGFISSIIKFNRQKNITSQDYLDLSGNWVLHLNYSDEKVKVNPDYQHKFKQDEYLDMNAVIQEIMMQQDHNFLESDQLMLPYKKEVMKLFNQASTKDKLMLVNYSATLTEPLIETAFQPQQIVVGKYEHKALFEENYPNSLVHFMPPVDTRVQLGHSNRISQEILLIILDEEALVSFEDIADQLSEAVNEHDDIRLRFVMVNGLEIHRLELITRLEESSLGKFYGSNQYQDNDDSTLSFDETVLAKEIIEELILLKSEVELIELLRFTRVTLDLSIWQNDYIKLSSLSAGIPMIINQSSIYVQHMENGYLLDDLSQLSQAINYYLSSLNNWNKASIAAIRKNEYFSEQFNVEKLLIEN